MTALKRGTVVVYKKVGLTPLDCVKDYKALHPELNDVTVSYAGRLDPMAEGLLLLLVGEENKNRRAYEHADKEYELDILFGVATDTGDLMGKITQVQNTKLQINNYSLTEIINRFVGTHEQKYPIYSSIKVQGKPLYWWARQNRLSEIHVPSHTICIKAIQLLTLSSITSEALLKRIHSTVPFIQGDFRQNEIVDTWEQVLSSQGTAFSFPVARIRVTCGSGTYMRMLAEEIGERCNIPACASHIKRTRIGSFTHITS